MEQTPNPDLWVAEWKAISAPEVAIPLVPLLLIALYARSKIKGAVDYGKLEGMKGQIDAANQRLLLANEQRAAGGTVEREVETLRKQVANSRRGSRQKRNTVSWQRVLLP